MQPDWFRVKSNSLKSGADCLWHLLKTFCSSSISLRPSFLYPSSVTEYHLFGTSLNLNVPTDINGWRAFRRQCIQKDCWPSILKDQWCNTWGYSFLKTTICIGVVCFIILSLFLSWIHTTRCNLWKVSPMLFIQTFSYLNTRTTHLRHYAHAAIYRIGWGVGLVLFSYHFLGII